MAKITQFDGIRSDNHKVHWDKAQLPSSGIQAILTAGTKKYIELIFKWLRAETLQASYSGQWTPRQATCLPPQGSG